MTNIMLLPVGGCRILFLSICFLQPDFGLMRKERQRNRLSRTNYLVFHPVHMPRPFVASLRKDIQHTEHHIKVCQTGSICAVCMEDIISILVKHGDTRSLRNTDFNGPFNDAKTIQPLMANLCAKGPLSVVVVSLIIRCHFHSTVSVERRASGRVYSYIPPLFRLKTLPDGGE